MRRSAAGVAAALARHSAVGAAAARLKGSRFALLFREFVQQFFASESATSDHQLRTAIIGVVAFLITPGLLIPVEMGAVFEFIALRHPEMMDAMVQLLATVFITYCMVTIGVIAAFTWDTLGFDRRDAMVLGPLPVSGRTVIAAKLAALAALLLSCAAIVNVLTAVPFALTAGNHTGLLAIARHFTAHILATMSAATFVFCVLVTVRALAGMMGTGRIAIASLLQFALVGALLCFIVMIPEVMDVVPGGRRRPDRILLTPIPGWSPTNWFLGLYETVRSADASEFGRSALTGVLLTLGSVAAAILTTIASYRRQLQLALTPSASAGMSSAARLVAATARLLAGRHRVARATADFVVSTLLRNRAQQVPIALNAAISVAIAVAALSRNSGGLSTLSQPRTIVLWIPLLLAYWMMIGVRASLFVPSELPAAWVFRANAPHSSRAYWSGTRAAVTAVVMPPVLFVAAMVTIPLLGWRIGAWHVAFVGLMVLALVELIMLTINFVPFTRPYPPGHAKLKSRWPIYLFGMFAFARWPIRWELRAFGGGELTLLASVCAAAAVLHAAGWWTARKWSVEPRDEFADDLGHITVLDIGGVVHGTHIGG